MEKVNHKIIEIARMSRGLTQKDLASLLPNINQPNLSKVEKGELNVTKETLNNIASTLSYPIGFFYKEELKTPFSNIYFRKRSVIPQKKLDKIFADIKIILTSIDLLLADIDLAEYPRYSFDLTDGWTPESVAIRMREILKIPSGPIKDIVTKIENTGIIIYFYDSPDDKFDGLTAYTNDGHPVIFVNKNMPNDRIKFTIVHEFGHLVMHIPCNVEPWREFELETNKFTSEFFMPKKECYHDLRTVSFNRLGILKTYWGISKAAIIRRAKDVDAIPEATYKYLMIELGRKNERKNETGYVEIDEPKILNMVIDLLKTELGQTKDEIAESLKLGVNDYCKIFDDNDGNIKPKLRFMKSAV